MGLQSVGHDWASNTFTLKDKNGFMTQSFFYSLSDWGECSGLLFIAQSPTCVWLFTPWTAACQTFLSLSFSRSLPKFMFIALVMLSSHLILWQAFHPLLPSSPSNKPLLLLSCFSHVWLFVTPLIVVYQTPPSMGFSRQEYWSVLPFPSLTNKA